MTVLGVQPTKKKGPVSKARQSVGGALQGVGADGGGGVSGRATATRTEGCTAETDWPPIKAMPCPRFQVPYAPNPNPLHYTHKHCTPHSQCLMGVTLTLFLWPPGLSTLPLPLG